jgi:hypothetical protein
MIRWVDWVRTAAGQARKLLQEQDATSVAVRCRSRPAALLRTALLALCTGPAVSLYIHTSMHQGYTTIGWMGGRRLLAASRPAGES